MLTPTLASVIVLRMPDFARRSVREQTRLKADLETLVALAIRPLAAADRIVLETPDGAAIAVLGEPHAALEMAERAQAANPSLCIGANHGAIRAASDALRGPGLIGDGIAAGVIVASAATPGRLLASRAFRDALEAHAPTHAGCLSSVGTFTDPDVRTHELFAVDRLAMHARKRRRFVVGASSTAAIVGLGLTTWFFLGKEPVRPAVVLFEIAPHGDVVVDGVVKGKSPPLTHLELIPGPHNIEVRNAGFPPLYLNVDLGSGEEMTIRHSFTRPKPTQRSRSPEKKRRHWWNGLGF